MKKIATFVLLLTAIFLLGQQAEAKTTPRKKATTTSSSRSVNKTFGANTLIQKGNYSNGFESNIETTLLRMGFTQNGSVYSRDGISVDTSDPLSMKVTFPNEEERDKFIEGTKALGYQWDGITCTNGRQLSLDISVEGNIVKIYFPD